MSSREEVFDLDEGFFVLEVAVSLPVWGVVFPALPPEDDVACFVGEDGDVRVIPAGRIVYGEAPTTGSLFRHGLLLRVGYSITPTLWSWSHYIDQIVPYGHL